MVELPGYSIEEKISWKHGVLYRGKRDKDEKAVLIMVCGSPQATDAQSALFKHRFSMIMNLKSEGLISICGMEEFGGGFAVIFHDFTGTPLKDYFFDRRCDIMEFVEIALQLAKALGEIHRGHIIHGGIKPGNIFIDPKTRKVKIIEQGLSSLFKRENEQVYEPEALNDTLPYMSPEQTGRMNRIIDYSTDFYSLGIVLYELITGSLPFSSDNPLELFHSHIARTPRAPIRQRTDIPVPISEIILKLLSKNSEDRYHCSDGLVFDLEKCRRQLEINGRVEPFEIGETDISGELDIPQKIYGRRNEIDELVAAVDRVGRGVSELVLVTGYAGIGKSTLVNEMSKTIVTRGGYFLTGKYEQMRMNVPYSALVEAFEGLINQLLTESEDRIAQWKDRLVKALGNSGKIIADVIPTLELLIGEQPEIPLLRSHEAQTKFKLIFQDFVRVFSESAVPMVIFLDDLQWAGSPALDFIRFLMSDPSLQHILLVAACRGSEVGPSGRLGRWLESMNEAGLHYNQLYLEPLDFQSVQQLVHDTLKSQSVGADSLSKVIHEKTEGNPFFVRQFLTMLYDQKMLKVSPETGWQWDIDDIKKMEAADNVVDLTIKKMRDLPEASLNVLKASSCFERGFHLEELAQLYAKSIDETYADLFVCIEQGLIFLIEDTYMFSHDRIHETAYSLLSEDEKRSLHYRIGKILLKHLDKDTEVSDKVLNVVNQLDLGMDLIIDEKERVKLAELNLRAGRKVKSSGAYEAANRFFEIGIEVLPKDAWEKEYEPTLALYTEMGETSYLTGDNEQADAIFDVVIQNARSLLDKVRVYETKITSYTVGNRREEALMLGMEALSLLDFPMPEKVNPQVIMEEIELVKQHMGNRHVKDLIHLPELNDPYKLAVARIFISCSVSAYTSAPEFLPLIAMKLVNLSLESGNSRYSPYAYVIYGLILCGKLGEVDLGYRFGRLALDLTAKLNATELEAKVYYVFGDMINHWKNHYREDLTYLLESYRSGSENGDLAFASYALNHYVMTSFLMGEPLNEVKEKLERYGKVIEKYQQLSVIQEYRLLYQMVLNLLGEGEDKLRIRGEMSDEETTVAEWKRTKMFSGIGYYTVEKQFLLYLHRDYKGSMETAEAGERCVDSMIGMNLFVEYHFYYSLALLAYYPDASEDEKADYLKRVVKHQEKMKEWASHAPENFEHKYLLVEAEISRLRGGIKSTVSLFDRAIESAWRNGFIQDEAIAHERAALYCLSEGMEKIARIYMREAYNGYQRWGTVTKVADLENEYPYLSAETGFEKATEPDNKQSPTSSWPDASTMLDYRSIVESLQSISSEIVLDDLLKQLMKIVVEISGATRGVIILYREKGLSVEAERVVLDREITTVHSFPLDQREDLLIPLVNYVKRTKEYVALDDASNEGHFTLDPYVLRNQSKSICCLPVVRQSRPVGILYLENSIATGAFTPERMEVLQLFAIQAAISIENALLVDSMAKAERALRDSEEEYRNLLERANDGIVIVQDELFKYVNERMTKMFGYVADEILDRHLSQLIHPDDYPVVLDRYRRRMAGEKVIALYEIRIKHRDGHYVPIEVHAGTGMYNRRPAGLIICRDITERKRIQEELIAKERLLNFAIEQLPIPVCVANAPDGDISILNQAAIDLMVRPQKHVGDLPVGRIRDYWPCYRPDGTPYSVYELPLVRAVREGRATRNEEVVIRHSNGDHWVSGNAAPLKDEHGNIVAAIVAFPEITELKIAQKELSRYRDQLEKLVEERTAELKATQKELMIKERLATLGKLTATVSHELRNPLGTIRSSIFLVDQLTQGKKLGIRKALDRADRSLVRCDGIIDELMDYSRVRELHLKPTKIDQWLDVALNEQVIPKGVTLTWKPGAGIEIPLDREHFRRCIVNVMDNAFKAIEEKRGDLKAEDRELVEDQVVVESRATRDRLEIRITDTGTGIPPDHLGKIFEPLFSTRGFGVGLGLSIVRQIMEQHGGGIEIESAPGNGTKVILWLLMEE
ncbi:MAG: AAA family ATPase [Thermodesulfobacteriota bacterium]|nr:AAA family ATPase [Thermodesulfobacteriota bacterium]